jgi:hypothetical protein
MQSQNAASPPSLSWRQLLDLFSPAGQASVVAWITEARETRGANWLPEIKAEFPMFSWIVELACTCTADEAITQVAAAYPHMPVRTFGSNAIRELHAKLKFEIERKR